MGLRNSAIHTEKSICLGSRILLLLPRIELLRGTRRAKKREDVDSHGVDVVQSLLSLVQLRQNLPDDARAKEGE